MGVWHVTSPEGTTLEIEGDVEPTEDELSQLFEQHAPEPIATPTEAPTFQAPTEITPEGPVYGYGAEQVEFQPPPPLEPEISPFKRLGRGFMEAGAKAAEALAAESTLGPMAPPGTYSPQIDAAWKERLQRTGPEVIEDIRTHPLYQAGKVTEEAKEEMLPLTPAEEASKIGGALEAGTGMAGYVASGATLAPGLIGMEAFTKHIVEDYDKWREEGMSDQEASAKAFDTAVKSGGVQAASFAALPAPLRKLGDAYLVNRFGRGVVSDFLAKRAAQVAEGATLMGSVQASENVVTGKPITEGVPEAAKGGAVLFGLTPRGGGPETITSSAWRNPETGKVYYGANHPAILESQGKPIPSRSERNVPEFGYKTDRRPFVSREEAAPIAKRSGQQLERFDVKDTQPHSDQISSEPGSDTSIAESSPEQVAKEIGFTVSPEKQIGSVKLTGLTDAELAKFREAGRKLDIEFTDRRPDSPTKGVTFYVPENASRAEILDRYRSKLAEYGVSEAPAGAAAKLSAPETRTILDALAARAQEADTPNAKAVRLMLRRGFGLESGGPIRVIHAPEGSSLGTIWWDKAGNPVGIQINAAKISGSKQLHDVLLHEVGHWVDLTAPKPVVDAITKLMSVAEKKEIISDVKRLKYSHGQWKKEFRADAVRIMAAKWAERNPTWWQNIVANVSRIANETLGIKLSRLGAENAAARSIAIAIEAIKSKGKEYAHALEFSVKVPEAVAKDMPEIVRLRLLEQVQKEFRKGGFSEMKAEEPPKTPEEKPTTDDALEGKPGYSIAQEGREAGAAAGTRPLVEPGQGIGRDAAIERGRKLRESGYDVEGSMRKFEQTGAVDPDAVMAARAEGEARYRAANEAAKKFGEDSAEYWKAWESLAEWDRRTKPMATALHKGFMAHQGETDIDTGTITGLRRAYKDQTAREGKEGKEFTPKQEKQAKKLAEKSGKANESADKARQDVLETVRRNAKTVSISEAEQRALDAASKTVREAAIRMAEAQNKRRVATTVRERQAAEIQAKAAERALNAANQRRREAAIRAAKEEQKRLADPSIPIWEKANEYLEKGMRSFDDIRNAVATDLGMPVDQVTRLLARDKKAKYQMNDLWSKQQKARQLKQTAQRWLKDQDQAPVSRALARVPRILFSIRVGFHGTVALGTHAPMVAYQPRFWKLYVENFARMYRMVGSPTYYEMQVQDMMRRPNYVTARRAGLQNDPFQYEDFNSPDVTEYMKAITHMGNRGYAVLKIIRQDMFDQMWNVLPKTTQIPEIAQAIADGLNHATGVTKKSAPGGVAVALFAPRLEASRVAWLVTDPARAVITATNWKNATPGEKFFAIQQVKEKAWVAGTLFSMLALNQGFLSAIDSDQHVNFDDPFRSDWLKFKAGGMVGSYGNPMVTMARLPVRLYHIVDSPGGKKRYLIYPDEDTYTVLGEYARSQASPFASLVTDLWMRSDWQRRPLPSSNRPVPKRLRAQGIGAYTWPEFWTQQALPIPFQEAVREVWKEGLGMNEEQIKSMSKAMATIAVMGGTGARLYEDIPYTGADLPRKGPKLPSSFAIDKPKFEYMTGIPGQP